MMIGPKTGQLFAYVRDDRPWGGGEPYAYLNDLISRIVAGHPHSQPDELLPWAYAAAGDLKAVA